MCNGKLLHPCFPNRGLSTIMKTKYNTKRLCQIDSKLEDRLTKTKVKVITSDNAIDEMTSSHRHSEKVEHNDSYNDVLKMPHF